MQTDGQSFWLQTVTVLIGEPLQFAELIQKYKASLKQPVSISYDRKMP